MRENLWYCGEAMNRKKAVVLACGVTGLLLLAAAVWFFFIRESEEAAIRRTFSSAQELIRKNGEKQPLAEAGDFRGLQKLADESITISGGNRYAAGDFRTEDLLRMFIQGRKFLQSLSVEFHEMEIRIAEDGETASVSFSLAVSGRLLREKESFRDFFECRASLKKRGRGDWILTGVTLDPVIRRHNS